jgi:hypothetical protein
MFPPGPPGHIPWLHMPGSLMPIPVYLEQQRQVAEAARWMEINDAAAAMQATGTTCEIPELASGGEGCGCRNPIHAGHAAC